MATSTTSALTVTASHGLDAVLGSDLVIVSATPVRPGDQYPAEVLEVVRAAHAAGSTVLSLCSGSFVLGAAGLLDGRACTTHWRYVEAMEQAFPAARIDPRALYVDDGSIVTSAGTAAGIDACLHLVRRELGTAVATKIARRMVVPPQRDGGQRQYIDLPLPTCEADSLAPLLTWMREHLAEEQPVRVLARRAAMSERTFARRFAAETGTTPGKWLLAQRLHHARALLESSDLAVETVAMRAGFGSAALLRHHFGAAVGVAPAEYRRTFRAPDVRAG
jgi:AraC family transcriptional activator FtrA